jgi:hypothetical protein
MAHYNPDSLLKKNSKLEAFLKRNLDVECVERIRASDACIVCSERDDKAFKYVVLSDEWLYLAENPPKKLEETVHLRDIVNIKLVRYMHASFNKASPVIFHTCMVHHQFI